MTADILMLAGNDELCEASVGGGNMVAFTSRAPDKSTENEDSVAAIPFGPDAVVLIVADGAGGLPGGRRASQAAVHSLR